MVFVIEVRPVCLRQFTANVQLNIQIDTRVMNRGYKKFQIALVKRSDGFVGGLYRVESRSLYRPSSKYVELSAC